MEPLFSVVLPSGAGCTPMSTGYLRSLSETLPSEHQTLMNGAYLAQISFSKEFLQQQQDNNTGKIQRGTERGIVNSHPIAIEAHTSASAIFPTLLRTESENPPAASMPLLPACPGISFAGNHQMSACNTSRPVA